jgi:SsrA-binding protein
MSLVDNPRAKFDYELLDRYEAGLELSGFEVKALKLGRGKLQGARVLIRGGEAYLVGATIEPYQAANLPPGYEPGRAVRVLLTKKEIGVLAGSEAANGLTIVPLAVYNKDGRLKLELALARGKKKGDKRQSIKQRETDRDISRTLKRGR